MRKTTLSLFFLTLLGGMHAQAQTILAISETEVKSLAEFDVTKSYVIRNYTIGFLYETDHTCQAQGTDVKNSNHKIARGNTIDPSTITSMDYVFTVTKQSDGSFVFTGQTGDIDNLDPGVTTAGAQLHMTSEGSHNTFTISSKGETDGVQYFGVTSTQSDQSKKYWDYGGGADGGGIVMAYNPSENTSKFAFYQVVTSENNKVTFKDASNITALNDAGLGLATYSAAFATVMPTGVTAYTVGSTGTGTATLKKLVGEGETLPANCGVILTGTKNSTVTISASDDASTFSGINLLANTATGPVDLSAITGATPFILGANGEGNVAFYAVSSSDAVLAIGKAYLSVPTGGGEGTIRLSFGDNLTGIDNVATAAKDAKVVDLSGRRVNKTTKGSLYISGGKVFIAQ